jgi:hypothetical protein
MLMNQFLNRFMRVALLMASCVGLCTTPGFAEGTAFSYQGRLNSGTNSAAGIYDFKFALFATNSGGAPSAGPVTNFSVNVTGGLFTTMVDFGGGYYVAGGWFELAVRTNGATNFTTLAPRQRLTPTPSSFFADTSSNLLGALPVSQLSGCVSLAQLPPGLVTNNQSSVSFGSLTVNGVIHGDGSGLTNLAGGSGAGIISSATNFNIYDASNRPVVVMPTTQTNYFTNVWTVRGTWPGAMIYNGVYTYWPAGSTNGYVVFTNAAQMLVQAFDGVIWSFGGPITGFSARAGNWPISYTTWFPDYLNGFDYATAAVDTGTWADNFSGDPVFPEFTPTRVVSGFYLPLTIFMNVNFAGSNYVASGIFFGNGAGLTNIILSGIAASLVTNNPALGVNALMTNGVSPAEIDISGAVNSPAPGTIWSAAPVAPLIFHNQPYPGSEFRLTNDIQILTNLFQLQALGLLANLTNSGMPLEVDLDVGGFVRDENGKLFWRTNIYPNGFTNFVKSCAAYGFEVGVMRNVIADVGPMSYPGFWALGDANIGNHFFQSFTNYNPQSWDPRFTDAMTPDKIPDDIMTLYLWGVAAVTGNDVDASYYNFYAIEKTVAWNCIMPYWSQYHTRYPWFTLQYSAQQVMPVSKHMMRFTAYESVNVNPEFNAQDLIGWHNSIQWDAPENARYGTMAATRSYRQFTQSFPDIKKCNQGGVLESLSLNNTDGSIISALCGWSPMIMLLDTGNFIQQTLLYTNRNWQRIHNDPDQNWPRPLFNTLSNLLVLAKPLSTGNTAIGFFNEGSTSTNITIGWPQIGLPVNQPAAVLEIFGSNYLTTTTGSFSTNLAPHTSAFLEIQPQAPSGVTTNVTLPGGTTLFITNGVIMRVQ